MGFSSTKAMCCVKNELNDVIKFGNINHTLWTVTYYSGDVYDSIYEMPKKIKARYVALTERMIEKGPDLGMPHTRAMGGGLYEIRIKAQEGIVRCFYCIKVKNEIVILHTFIKKTQKTPTKEIETARKRMWVVKNND